MKRLELERGVMAAGGKYAADSTTQHGAAGIGLPLIGPAVAAAEFGADGPPLVIADLGAAEGTNSLLPIGAALEAIAAAAPGRPVLVVHADIPGNDFTVLAETLEQSPERYTLAHPEALPLMAGRSLYGPIFPAGTLSFAWTASTLHWLSAAPGPVRGHFFVQLSADEEAKAAFRERSAADWRAFLDARAAELAPGAGVVIVDVAIDAGELERIAYPTWFRSLDELREPFAPEYVAAGGERLQLVALEPHVLSDPFDPHGDAEAYARAQVDFLAGFLEPSFDAALREDRDEAERRAALAAVWQACRELVAADPVGVSPRYQLVAGLIAKPAAL